MPVARLRRDVIARTRSGECHLLEVVVWLEGRRSGNRLGHRIHRESHEVCAYPSLPKLLTGRTHLTNDGRD